MKKIVLLLAMLAMVALAAVPALAQDGGDANLGQEQNNAAVGGTSVAAAGNNFSAQNQEASNSAETNIAQTQAASVEQNAASKASAYKWSKAFSGDIFQFAGISFGDQSADVETNQANFQNQENTQNAEDNTATADSSADADADQTGTATGGAGGLNFGFDD